MITTKRGMDPHSLDLMRDGKHIGYLQWHPNHRTFGSAPRIVLLEPFGSIAVSEIETAMAEYHRYH